MGNGDMSHLGTIFEIDLGVVARHDSTVEEGVVRVGLDVLRCVLGSAADGDMAVTSRELQLTCGVFEARDCFRCADTLEDDLDRVLGCCQCPRHPYIVTRSNLTIRREPVHAGGVDTRLAR